VAAWPFFRSAARISLLAAAALGCQQKASMSPPSSTGGTGGGSDAATLQSLGISVTGCASFNVKDTICSGTAPLTVSFAPVGSSAFTNFLWDFDDGSPRSTELAPVHTFTLPSSTQSRYYAVTVTGQIGETGGTVASAPTEVVVTSVPAGAACDIDQQCGQGLQCLCQVGAGCSPAFTRGICSTACATGFCGIGSVCADITLGPTAADAGAAGPFCLTDCSGSTTCGPGYVCQKMPGGPGGSPWVSGCLPRGAARDFGLSCRDANGVLQDRACATGYCADIGTLGMCTAICDSAHPCPSGGACAHLPGGPELCLPACSTATPCTGDPGLGCTTPPDGAVDGGLTVTGSTAGAAYCAPR
jgi:PKD repeat protein